MQQRRRLARRTSARTPVLAVLTTAAFAAAALFGGSQIVHVQSIGNNDISVALASESFASGDNVTVDDAAVKTQGSEEDEHRVVKEFTRDQPFSMVGLTWEGERDIVAYVRAQREDGSWSQWYEMDPAETVESNQNGTDPIYIEPTTRIQVSTGNVDLLGDGRTDSDAPTTAEDLQAVFIDGGEGTVDGGIAPVADSYAWGMPQVVSRASWGAAPSRNSPDYTEPTKAITVHHTAGSNNYSEAEAPGIVRGIQTYHQQLGWGDIGYNALVDKYGNIYEGRAGGLDRGVMGAHVGAFNSYTWGISVLGNYDIAQPTAESIQALGDMIGWKAAQAGIDPKGTVQLTATGYYNGSKYDAGETGIFNTINAHRDFHYNTCPGQYLYNQMATIREKADQKYLQLKAGNPATQEQPKPETSESEQSESEQPTESEQKEEPAQEESEAVTTDNGVKTTVTRARNAASRASVSLERLSSRDPEAIAEAAGTLAGTVILYLITNTDIHERVARVGETEILPGLTLSSVRPYISSIAQLVGGDEAAAQWAQFESALGTLQGVIDRVGSVDYAFYDNGIGVQQDGGQKYSMAGAIADAWLQQGLDAGPLGLPVSNAYSASENNDRVDFEGGSITYNRQDNTVNIDLEPRN